LENNLYFSPSVNLFVSGFSRMTKHNFSNWNSNVGVGTEAGGLFADPLLQKRCALTDRGYRTLSLRQRASAGGHARFTCERLGCIAGNDVYQEH
jgi:hypothetical protein